MAVHSGAVGGNPEVYISPLAETGPVELSSPLEQTR